ncbi:hypothetical protein DRQ53_07725 [bacterium]|nr:MAG: hypothetical protein DRQ53_07725 [bacterium]
MTNVIHQTINITGFVFVMLLLIDYLNVMTQGLGKGRLARNRWGQYLIAVLLGATPGCLGAFLVVGMYTHRLVSMGALVAAMIATSGDEAFVMFALVPGPALALTLGLLLLGILVGAITDHFHSGHPDPCVQLEVHEEDSCRCFSHGDILTQLRNMTLARGVLLILLVSLLVGLLRGYLGPPVWNWIRVTTLSLTTASLLIVISVPEHFLEQHLWNHVVRKHVPRIFAWTLGTLLVLHFMQQYLPLQGLIRDNLWIVLVLASVVGLIPESGPHLVFLTLYAEGTIPISILLASSIVQDGHGMLPLLAHSRKDFVYVKLINLAVGLGIGALALLLRF